MKVDLLSVSSFSYEIKPFLNLQNFKAGKPPFRSIRFRLNHRQTRFNPSVSSYRLFGFLGSVVSSPVTLPWCLGCGEGQGVNRK